MELLHRSNLLASNVLRFYCAWQLSLCRSHWRGCLKAARFGGCVRNIIYILLSFAGTVNRIGVADAKLRMVILQQSFLHFGAGDSPFKMPFKQCCKIAVFPLWRRDPVLKLQFLSLSLLLLRVVLLRLAIQCPLVAVEWLY